jgi:hypothetical protein
MEPLLLVYFVLDGRVPPGNHLHKLSISIKPPPPLTELPTIIGTCISKIII